MCKIQLIEMHGETVKMSIICFKKRSATAFVNSFVLETFAKLPLATVISLLFFCPSEWNNWAPAGRSLVIFYNGIRILNRVEKFQGLVSRTKITCI